MRRSLPLPTLIAATGLTVLLSACAGGGNGTPVMLSDVAGRGLQPPWFAALPTPTTTPEQVSVPEEIHIPADALFPSGSSELRPSDRARIEAFARALAPQLDRTPGRWTVVGATDTTGSHSDNDSLGYARAAAVAQMLTSAASVDPDRIRTTSWGERCPAVDESTAHDLDQARAQNRRVVIVPPQASPSCPIP